MKNICILFFILLLGLITISCGERRCTYTVSYEVTSNNAATLDKIIFQDSHEKKTLVNVQLPWVYNFSITEIGGSFFIASIEGDIFAANNAQGNTVMVKINVSGGDGNLDNIPSNVDKTITSIVNTNLHFKEEASRYCSNSW